MYPNGYRIAMSFFLSLDDVDFCFDQGFWDESGEVGHYFFDLWAAAGEACDGGRAGEDERGDLFGEAFDVGTVLAADGDAELDFWDVVLVR